jgi:hypothetical protein
MGMARPPKFYRAISWDVFQCQFETVAEHNCSTHLEKSMHLITTLQGCAANVLHGIPKGVMYEETLDAKGDRFWDQHLATTYHNY